jgi:hypothetical protein
MIKKFKVIDVMDFEGTLVIDSDLDTGVLTFNRSKTAPIVYPSAAYAESRVVAFACDRLANAYAGGPPWRSCTPITE